ncbi:hypothetical protein GCM10010980_24740 [Corynebacterium marinum]|nr:hypothetical protein GCM10010980_24740 [Corynebacterium marinum]
MPSKTYSEEFRRDTVGLYESSPGVSLNALAAELGVNRNTLQRARPLESGHRGCDQEADLSVTGELTPVWWTPNTPASRRGGKVVCHHADQDLHRGVQARRCCALSELPGSSVQEIATDLGISRTTLKNWIAKYRTSTSTAPKTAHALTEVERIRQLEREVRRLREERDILRKAAKYLAEETNR